MNKTKKNLLLSALVIVLLASSFSLGFYKAGGFNDLSASDFGIGGQTVSESEYVITDGERTDVISAESTPAEDLDLDPFWKVWNIIDEKFVVSKDAEKADSTKRLYGAIGGMVDSLNDPYTTFLPPAENEIFQEDIRGNFEGVGMEVGMRDERLTVVSPLEGSPAKAAGVLAGDIILQIDDKITNDLSIDEAVNLIRGEAGTQVKLLLVRKDVDEPINISITRGVIKLPTLQTEKRDDGVFVISLFNFGQNASSDFKKALREFAEAKTDKLVLDLRGNPGGFLDSSIEIASWFLPTGKIIVREDFGKGEEYMKVIRSKGYDVFSDEFKMVILINGGSASASEILAGALSEHDIATLVGETTFGKGSVQELIDITEDTSLKITIAKWLTPNGISISDGGLTPDVVVENDPESPETDLQLEKAIEILLNK